MNIEHEAVSEFRTGNGTIGTAPKALDTGVVYKHVVIRAKAGNTGTIGVGNTKGNAATGFILAAGEQTPPIYADDLSKVFIVGSDAGQLYNWVSN